VKEEVVDTITQLAVLVPLVGALLAYALRREPRASAAVATLTPMVSMVVLLLGFRTAVPLTEVWWSSWVPGFLLGVRGVGFVMKLDGLSLAMCVMTCILYAASMLYALPYLEEKGGYGSFYSLAMILLCALLGVFLSWNLLAFYTFWELMAVPSFFLIAEWGYGRAREAALKFFLYTRAGALLIILAMAMAYNELGTLDLGQLALSAAGWDQLPLAAFLLTVGFLIKAGCFPLHSWLPDAHSQAPAPFSALLSGVLVATGVYSIARIPLNSLWIPAHAGNILPLTLAAVGVASTFFGSFRALKETDIKRIPAYSSISHMGYALAGLGLGSAAALSGHPQAATLILAASLFHLVAHAWSKGLLFLASGSVMHLTGERNILKMSGLMKKLPITAAAMLAAAMSIAGSPPFACFVSEVSMIVGSAKSGLAYSELAAASLALATVLSAGYALRLIYHVLWRSGDSLQAHEEPTEMSSAMLALGMLIVLLFFFPSTVLRMIEATVRAAVGG